MKILRIDDFMQLYEFFEGCSSRMTNQTFQRNIFQPNHVFNIHYLLSINLFSMIFFLIVSYYLIIHFMDYLKLSPPNFFLLF